MIRKLARSIREYKKESILSGIFILVEVVMEIIIPLILAYLIDDGIKASNIDVVYKSSIQLVIIATISLISGVLASRFSAIASAGFAKNLRKDMYFKIQDYSFSNIDKFSSSSLVTRLTTDISYIQNAYMMIIRTALRSPFMLVCALVSVFSINKKISLIYLAIIPFLGISLFTIATKAHPKFKKVFETYDELNNDVQENVRGIRVVKAYVKEEEEKKKFGRISKLIYDRFTNAEKIVAWNQPVMQFSMYACNLLLAFFATKMIVGGTLTTGKLTSLFSYTGQILSSLMMLSMIYVMTIISATSAERVCEVLEEESDIKNIDKPIKEVKNGDIEFKNVSFGYSKKKDKLVLKNVNLSIKSGEVIGIIGGTGSSKSTLVNLINRLYDVNEGEVLLGGINVKNYDLKTLRDNVSVVLQKNVLFSGTILDNMRWGKKDATLEEVKKVCHLACADEFIETFKDKYDYVLDQGGTNVSGGQKQRLCIARALLKNPKVLIFDDSTSAVDTKTDATIRKNLSEYLPNVTKIIIAQRIASVEDADKVIVLDKGKVVDYDTPKNLLKNNKIYKEVYESQKRGVK
jgi:ATP-binding cassette subfamily B protein